MVAVNTEESDDQAIGIAGPSKNYVATQSKDRGFDAAGGMHIGVGNNKPSGKQDRDHNSAHIHKAKAAAVIAGTSSARPLSPQAQEFTDFENSLFSSARPLFQAETTALSVCTSDLSSTAPDLSTTTQGLMELAYAEACDEKEKN